MNDSVLYMRDFLTIETLQNHHFMQQMTNIY